MVEPLDTEHADSRAHQRGSLPGDARVKYQAYGLSNLDEIRQLQRLSQQQKHEMRVVAQVLPFKTNNYVVNRLIDWDAVPEDPLFILNFPQRGMLRPEHYDTMSRLLLDGADARTVLVAANEIRMQLNPQPAGQIEHNVPRVGGQRLRGIQHKYDQTVLFFPSQGQTCHAYCTFCFRWPQFTHLRELKFAARETDQLVSYVRARPEINDVLFTGGDPLIMSTPVLGAYLDPLLRSDLPNLRRIRIGTKALSYWPYRFLGPGDGEALLGLFRRVIDSGLHLTLVAHFNHPRELESDVVEEAIAKLRATGATIRTQSPLLRPINADPRIWVSLWNRQVDLGCIPYYMFVARDTGAQHYFGVPLVEAWGIFRDAYRRVSGLARTVRGPSMSANPGKIQVLGVSEVRGEKVIVLRFLQGRSSDWVQRPFFAAYDEKATWLNELRPAFGAERFFFEAELERYYRENPSRPDAVSFD